MTAILTPSQTLAITINTGSMTKTVVLDGIDISARVSAINVQTNTGQPGFNPGVITLQNLTITLDGVVMAVEGPCSITVT